MRTLLNGKKVKELTRGDQWSLGSKCPLKYLHVDCETGDLWVRNPRKGWTRPNRSLVDAAKKAVVSWLKRNKHED